MAEGKAYLEISFDQISDLTNYLDKLEYGQYYFRGLPDYSFQLKSKLQRVLEGNYCEERLWHAKEMFPLNYFKQQYKSLFNLYPKEDDIFNWLCLMQHYGAPTRLLDWTLSPYVGLFFSYSEMNMQNQKDGCLWIIRPSTIKSGILQRHEDFDDDLINVNRFILPEEGGNNRNTFELMEDVMSRINKLITDSINNNNIFGNLPIRGFYSDSRIIAQQGCFTIQLNLKKTLDGIPAYSSKNSFDGMQENQISYFSTFSSMERVLNDPAYTEFVKIKLPFSWKQKILQLLAKMNVSAANLFPGLPGLGLATQNYLILKNVPEPFKVFIDNSTQANDIAQNLITSE